MLKFLSDADLETKIFFENLETRLSGIENEMEFNIKPQINELKNDFEQVIIVDKLCIDTIQKMPMLLPDLTEEQKILLIVCVSDKLYDRQKEHEFLSNACHDFDYFEKDIDRQRKGREKNIDDLQCLLDAITKSIVDSKPKKG
jgi:hypothetical protein